MQKVLSDGLWAELRKRAKSAKTKRAAIAYYTQDHLALGRGDQLVVDASDHVIRSQATSASLLRDLHRRGVTVFSLPGLHAKVALLDGVSIVGSANSSTHSEDHLIEAAVVSDDPLLAAKIQQLISTWTKLGKRLVDSDLSRLVSLPKEKQNRIPGTVRRQRKRPVDLKQRVWVTPVKELPDEAHPEERGAATKGERLARRSRLSAGNEVSWIRFASRRSRFAKEARPGDLVIQIWTSLDSKRPRVLPPATLLSVQKERTCFRMFVEQAPLRIKEVPFGAFEKMVKSAELARPIKKSSSRSLGEAEAAQLLKVWKKASRGR